MSDLVGQRLTEAEDTTRADRLAHLEARIERAMAAPRGRRSGVRRTDRRAHAVYVCRGKSGAVLYVGISVTAAARLAAHSQGSTWFAEVTRIDIEHVPDRDSALSRELELIAALRPLHNRAGVAS